MAGTISLSLSQQFDALGNPLSGGLLYFYQAGTVATPQNAFQDAALTIPHPNPIVLNAAGRVPQFYLADGSIKVVLTDKTGDIQITADNILVVGPSSGGGGGGGVDPTTVLQSGDFKLVYGTGVIAGFVRANGRLIGSATSGATERANADTSALFAFLWGQDPNLAVSGGRGVSAVADFAANKTIALPDLRGFALAGLDDMGNSARGVFTGATFTVGNATTLGSYLGTPRRTLQLANLPPYTPTGLLASGTLTGGTLNSGTLIGGTLNSGVIASGNLAIATRNYSASTGASDLTHLSAGNNVGADAGLTNWASLSGTVTGTVTGTVSGTVTGSVSRTLSMDAQGGTSTPFDAQSTYLLLTFYLKL